MEYFVENKSAGLVDDEQVEDNSCHNDDRMPPKVFRNVQSQVNEMGASK